MTTQPDQPAAPPAISDFLNAVRGFRAAMVPSFSFVAFRRDGRWEIFRARITLHLPATKIPLLSVRTDNILAGTDPVGTDLFALEKCIDAMRSGVIEVGGETLHFLPRMGGEYGMTFIPLHPDGIASQTRIAVLQMFGNDQTGYLLHPPFDWELRAAAQPFDGVNELTRELNLATLPQHGSLFEAVAFNVVAIDNASHVDGTVAHFGLRLCEGLDTAKASIGYRVMSQGVAIARERIGGTAMTWSQVDGVQLGQATVDVPAAATIHAYACYDGATYQHWWFSDPDHSQNPRRAAYEATDKGLQKLKSLVRTGGKQAREFEAAVACLLWMLGFNSVYLGGIPRMSDAADVLVTTPQGHFAVVECTIGVLKAEHKLTHLVDRTAAVRNQLEQSNFPNLRVLPVIFTMKTRDEVQGDLDQARQLGILVVTQDDFERLFFLTLQISNADYIFSEAEKSLQ
ncbi:hypothetical protein [Novosphingobium sp.]|uniref:hypothetical protein n=1 Tax=Novosphingobium sp. TaxID=1874826 RepID=UPI003340AB0D